MNVDVWGRISIFIQCVRMAFLDIAVSQKKPLLDHGPSSSKERLRAVKTWQGSTWEGLQLPQPLLPVCIESDSLAFVAALLLFLLLLLLLLLLFPRQHQKLLQWEGGELGSTLPC